MFEWWTYRPSDFLMFAPRTYWRLLEMHNAALWPLQLVAIGLGLLMVAGLLRGRGPPLAQAMLALLALLWLVVAWVFHAQRYASINTAAPAFALAFGVEATLLLAAALTAGRGWPLPTRAGVVLMLVAVLGYPALGLLAGRSIAQAEVFAVVPDPTVLFTLGLLLHRAPPADIGALARWVAWLCWPIPLLWCIGSGLTLWYLHAADALVLPLSAGLAIAAASARPKSAT